MAHDDAKGAASPLDPAPSADRATGAGSQASMRSVDSADHPFPRQGDRHAVRGDRGDSVPDPLDPAGRAHPRDEARLEGREPARTPEPFIDDPRSLTGRPLEDYTSEPIPLADGDAGNDSG